MKLFFDDFEEKECKESMCMELVVSVDEAKRNIRYFKDHIAENNQMIANLGRFTHWFYDKETDSFGPSKFIGYADNNFEKYFYGVYYLGTDGRDSDDALAKFYKEVKDEELSRDLYAKLSSFLGMYGKKPKKTAVIYIQK